MLFKKLIKNLHKDIKNVKIRNLSLDSRTIKKGDLFFALKGQKFDGKKFIISAIKKGAAAVICSKNTKIKNTKIPIIKVQNPKKTLINCCVKFYRPKPKNIVAVTGTNGKTSVAEFFYQIFSLNKIPVASIGTLGIKTKKLNKKLTLTSPDIISLHRELTKIKKNKIDNVIIEASSHGLDQDRICGLNFKAGIFTNLSRDHLDYHKTMKNYLNSKLILFSKLMKENQHLITDSTISEFPILKKIANKKKLKIIDINNLELKNNNLIGLFQIKNLSMSIMAAKLCGLNLNKIKSILHKIQCVDGRLEYVRRLSNRSIIFVDYAHTPDALLTVLKALHTRYKRNITLVFGCGGERDKNKRPIMAKIAGKFCKKIYVTDDNPRRESAKKIREAIIINLNNKNFIEIPSRINAIKDAIIKSEPYEIILVAGKGHEEQQVYSKKIINISDKKIIKSVSEKNISLKKINFLHNSNILKNITKKKDNFFFKGVSINSKNIKKKNLFIAIKGPNYDGHNYVDEAFKKGANFCVVSNKNKVNKKKKCIIFNNTKDFLQKLAKEKRNKSNAKIIAVTGSSGKTTAKTMIGQILNSFSSVYYSPKSYNNHYGVPLSLSNLEADHKYGIFEIGMSKKGEIYNLSKLVKPDIAIITNIAEAHIENFANIDEIAKTKGEIISNIKKFGTVILNKDDKFFNYFKNLATKKKINIISFGTSKSSDIYPIYVKNVKGINIHKIQVINKTILIKEKNLNIYNILSCLGVLECLGLNLKKYTKFFKKLKPLKGRGKIYKIKRFKTNFNLIDESYNSNPLSIRMALKNFSKINKVNSKKYVIIGDMLELGSKTDFYHKNLSKELNITDIDKVFVYGDKALKIYKYINKNKKGNILQYRNDFDEVFSKIIKKNDFLMIKGSNATGLHKLTDAIIKGTKNVI
jgi:MurE/MurF fusion protein